MAVDQSFSGMMGNPASVVMVGWRLRRTKMELVIRPETSLTRINECGRFLKRCW